MVLKGIKTISFDAKNGDHIEGKSLFFSSRIPVEQGQGESFEKFFLSSAKIANLGFSLEIGKEMNLLFNRYGKLETLQLADTNEDEDILIEM